MGFFDVVGKMIKGEPVFDAQHEQSTRPASVPQGANQQAADNTRTASGQKVEPEVRVTKLKTTRNGDKMVSYGWVQNNSPFAVEVTKLYIMGRGLAAGTQLGAGQGHDMKLYDGPVASSDRESHAYLDCKIVQNGDYFRQEFFVEYDRQSDGKFLAEELHVEEVRDI